MSFKDAIKTCFSKYADFSGRARRSEYWYWTLFNILVSAILGGINGGITSAINLGSAGDLKANLMSSGLAGLWSIAVLIPSLAVVVRRLHDVGKSGWYYLLMFIPIIGWIIVLCAFLKDSQGPNKYGDSPKYPAQAQYGYYQPQYQQPQGQQGYYGPQYQQPQQPYYPPQQQNYYDPNNNQQ